MCCCIKTVHRLGGHVSCLFWGELPGAQEPRELKGLYWRARCLLVQLCACMLSNSGLFESVVCQIKSQKLAMTRRGIEVKVCQNKTRELVAFFRKNCAFFPLSHWLLDFIEVHVWAWILHWYCHAASLYWWQLICGKQLRTRNCLSGLSLPDRKY